MEQAGYIVVSRDEGAVGFLNELEYIDSKVYANVWQTNLIVVASALRDELVPVKNAPPLKPGALP